MCFVPQPRAIVHLSSAKWLRTRRFSEPTFRPSGATNHSKNAVNRDYLFAHLHLLSSDSFSSLIFFFSDSSHLCFFHLSILSEVWLLKLPSTILHHLQWHRSEVIIIYSWLYMFYTLVLSLISTCINLYQLIIYQLISTYINLYPNHIRSSSSSSSQHHHHHHHHHHLAVPLFHSCSPAFRDPAKWEDRTWPSSKKSQILGSNQSGRWKWYKWYKVALSPRDKLLHQSTN